MATPTSMSQLPGRSTVLPGQYSLPAEDSSFLSDSSHADEASASLLSHAAQASGHRNLQDSTPPSPRETYRWAELGNAHRLERKSRSRRAWFLGTCMILVLGLMVLLQYIDDLRSLTTAISASTVTRKCRDPYTVPGFVWRSTDRKRMRWIPFSHANADTPTRGTPGNHSIDNPPSSVFLGAPPSLSQAFLDAAEGGSDRASDPHLAFLRGRKVATLGCSLDRNALESLCTTLGQGLAELEIDRHGRSSCHFKDLDFTAEVWFHAGTREWEDFDGRNYTFESLMSEDYIPRSRASGRKPDLLLLASGAWDWDWLQTISFPTEDVQPLPIDEESGVTDRDTPIMPWEAYAFYRTRLVDLVHFLRAQFPGTPLMFRTETYMSKGTNAQIYNMRQSAEYIMNQLDVPLFTWAEKLTGEKDMTDMTHFSTGSAPDWLYADQLLYYLRHFVEERTFCEEEE